MDRATLSRELALAEAHIRRGAEHIERQRGRVAELERDGHDATQARQLLVTFEDTQRLHVAGRDRIARELAAMPE